MPCKARTKKTALVQNDVSFHSRTRTRDGQTFVILNKLLVSLRMSKIQVRMMSNYVVRIVALAAVFFNFRIRSLINVVQNYKYRVV